MRLITFKVSPVMSSASTTPTSDSGSETRMASGSMKEPNWITRMRYISSNAAPSASATAPNTSCWLSTSPPWVMT